MKMRANLHVDNRSTDPPRYGACMTAADDDRPTLRAFDGLAIAYDQHRPHYPDAIIDALLTNVRRPDGGAPVIADIGCGTGISSRAIAPAAARVVAIDPGEDMLATARARSRDFPTIEFRKGTAEATGLAAESVDLVLMAQAFHWCDAERALVEFHRILRPGGRCGLLWNLRTSDGGFTDDYNRIVVAAATALDPSVRSGREALGRPLLESPLFTNATVVTAPSPQRLDEAGVVGRALSASYFPKMEPERGERLAELRASVRRHAVNGIVVLQQVAELTMATRR